MKAAQTVSAWGGNLSAEDILKDFKRAKEILEEENRVNDSGYELLPKCIRCTRIRTHPAIFYVDNPT